MELKKVTIIGPGSLGILFASKIWQKLPQLSLLDHNHKRAQDLNKTGIRLIIPGQEDIRAFPHVSVDAQELGPQDVVMILVKTFQTADVLDGLKRLCGPKTLVVTLQNGIGAGEMLERVVCRKNLVLGVTMHGANRRDFKTAVHAGSGKTYLGMFDSKMKVPPALELFVSLLDKCGFSCALVSDIYPIIWKKLLVNVGINALTALCCVRNGQLLDYLPLTAIQKQAVEEAYKVMKSLGVGLDMDFKEVIDLVRKVCMDTGDNISSMLQDRIKRNRTEIEYINGSIIRFGKKTGIETPVNQTLCNLVEFFSSIKWDTDCQLLTDNV